MIYVLYSFERGSELEYKLFRCYVIALPQGGNNSIHFDILLSTLSMTFFAWARYLNESKTADTRLLTLHKARLQHCLQEEHSLQ